jgi:hypothetical protein
MDCSFAGAAKNFNYRRMGAALKLRARVALAIGIVMALAFICFLRGIGLIA